MRSVVQRVETGSVHVQGSLVAAIGPGLVALIGVTHRDDAAAADAMSRKLAGLRVLADERSLLDTPGAAILVVSQFTLYGDTRRGRRPSWSAAAPGAQAEPLVARVVTGLRDLGIPVATGRFGADMRLALVNSGPVTLVLDV